MGHARYHAFIEKDGFLLWQSRERNLSVVGIVKLLKVPLVDGDRYIKTKILSEEAFAQVTQAGVQFAEAESAGQCLLRILSDASINGHSFFIAARKWASRGYMDLDLEDYPGNALIQEIQEDQMKSAPVSMGLFI